jgi:hypothetical protein
MTLESWNSFFQISSAILLGLTFFAGVGAIVSDRAVSRRLQARIDTVTGEARDANRKAEEATAGLAKALTDAARANERAAKAEEEAARFNKMAEEERIERLRLEARLKPRRLSQAQKDAIRSAISSFQGTLVHILSALGAWDGAQYARDFSDLCSESGWHVLGIGTWDSGGGPLPIGIELYMKESDGLVSAAVRCLQESLEQQEISAVIETGQKSFGPGTPNFRAASDRMLLLVGVKD